MRRPIENPPASAGSIQVMAPSRVNGTPRASSSASARPRSSTPTVSAWSPGSLDGRQLDARETEGLLHEHVLAGGEGLLHQGRVAVVAGGDHHGVGMGIRQGSGHVCTGLLEAMTAAHQSRCHAVGWY